MKPATHPDGTPRMPVSMCPGCGSTHDAASAVMKKGEPQPATAPRPKPGSFSVCVRCGCLSVFGEDLQLRLPHFGEYERAAFEDPDMARVIQAMRQAIRESPYSGPDTRRGGSA